MKINAINPFTHILDKNDISKFYLCFNMQGNLSEGISKMVSYKKPVFIMPSPNFYWDSDFLMYQKTIKDAISNSNIYLMDNQTKYLNDEKTGKKYRLIGGIFWNDFEGLNEELVTLSLIKSQNFQRIKADLWLENPENLKHFFELNENLKKNDVYYKIYKQYYKVGNFHPIISYLLYQDNLKYLLNEIKKPFDGETILLTHNQPTSFGLYFEGNQINSSSNNVNKSLNKLNNIESFVAKKTSLEVLLQKGYIQHLIHGNSNKFLGYQFYKTTISAINSSNISLDLENSSMYIKNTINFLLEENQKFVDIIRKSMINTNEVIEKTTDFLDFIKLYSFCFSLINNDYFKNMFTDKGLEIIFIDGNSLNIDESEISTNIISNLSEKMKYMLNVISKNHFTLQSFLTKF